MYLARLKTGSHFEYSIRKTVFDSELDSYGYRILFDLGRDPCRYIKRYSQNTFYFDEDLERVVANENQGDSSVVLEDLLWDFLPNEEKQRIKNFRRSPYLKLSKLSLSEELEIKKYVHIFDRRRLYFLRYGAVDQSRIYRVNDKLYRPLLYKCRDEKEYYIKSLELSLSASEFKKYVYVVFNLQRNFSEAFSTFMPEALEQQKVDEAFECELCRLNDDQSFWQDNCNEDALRYHLRDYLFRYFDYEYAARSYVHDFYQSFQQQHRTFRWPAKNSSVSEETVSNVFGEKIQALKKMNKAELTRLFRKKAKEFHPDSGGESEKFIQLLEAYELLKRRINS